MKLPDIITREDIESIQPQLSNTQWGCTSLISAFEKSSLYMTDAWSIYYILITHRHNCYPAKTAHYNEIFIRGKYLKCSNFRKNVTSSSACKWMITSFKTNLVLG